MRESRLDGVSLESAGLLGVHLRDVVVAEGSWANARARSATLRRVRMTKVRATGIELADAQIADVLVVESRFDLASFRFAKLERVVFRDCRLDEADFGGAELVSVLFERTALTRSTVTGARFTQCELRGCDLAGLVGPEALRGVRMPIADVVASADVLAAAVGVTILD